MRNTVAESRNLCAHEGKTVTDRLHLQISGIRKIVANIFRKPLDKIYIIWYNINVRGGSLDVQARLGRENSSVAIEPEQT